MGIASIYLYKILYLNVCYVMFVYLLLLAIIIYFNVHLMHALKVAQSRRSTMTSHSSNDENNITLIMIVITIAFVVCQTPASINHILYYITAHVPLSTCTPYHIYFKMSNLFVMIHSSFNVFIYCLFRKQFQLKLRMLFGRTCDRPSQQETTTDREGI